MAKQKRLKIRTGARTASKVQEKELISKAKKIRKNPDLIIPKCEHEGRCAFDKIRRHIQRIQSLADDQKKLASQVRVPAEAPDKKVEATKLDTGM